MLAYWGGRVCSLPRTPCLWEALEGGLWLTLLYNFFLSFLLCGVEGKPWLACADCKHLSEPCYREGIASGLAWSGLLCGDIPELLGVS